MKKIKHFLKKITKLILSEKLQTKIYLFRRRKYFGQRFIDFDLRKYLNFNDGFFIEMGAMDGVKYSNTLHLEKYKNWKGVLVEPSISNYKKCKKNRPASNVYNFLCSSFKNSGTEKLFYDIGAMSFSKVDNADLNYEEHLNAARKILSKDALDEKQYPIKCIAITELLQKSDAPKLINFFSLDVEGAELEVLNGLDFDKYLIQYLLIESRDNKKTIKFLKDYDYVLIEEPEETNLLFSHASFNSEKIM